MPHILDNPRPAPRKRFGPQRTGANKEAAHPDIDKPIGQLAHYDQLVEDLHIGLEFEMEIEAGRRWPDRLTETFWRQEHDGSLRDRGREFVFRRPLTLDQTLEAVGDLHTYIDSMSNPPRSDSTRTSTHVHLNVQDMSPLQVTNLACLWYVIEEAYSLTLPESRRGNLFALRACDTQRGPEEALRYALSTPRTFPFAFSDSQRYGALNLASVGKFGTVEFRLLPGMPNPLEVLPHLEAYIQLWKASQTFTDPQDIIDTFSGLGPEGFVTRYMSKMWALMGGVEENERYRALYRGMRYAQDIASIRKNWRVSDEVSTTEGEDVVQPSEPERLLDLTGTRYAPPQPYEDFVSYVDRRAGELGYVNYDDLPTIYRGALSIEWDGSRQQVSRQTRDIQSAGATRFNTVVDNIEGGREWFDEFFAVNEGRVSPPTEE